MQNILPSMGSIPHGCSNEAEARSQELLLCPPIGVGSYAPFSATQKVLRLRLKLAPVWEALRMLA